jgi:membrane-associated phospholipid phosphatase
VTIASRALLIALRRLALPLLAGVLIVAVLQPRLIHPRCVDQPRLCDPARLPAWDRWSLERQERWAVVADEALQWSVTTLALVVPVCLQVLPGPRLAGLTRDWLLLAETAAWNWTATETAQLLSQRPRPPLFNRVVNTKPADRRSQYTSFWSGHTSYVAAMGTALALLARRRARLRLGVALGVFAVGATLATGAFRILEGRHFLFDVVAGALAGALVACLVATRRRAAFRGEGGR